MKLTKLSLKNFRCYQAIELELHPQLTVLVANNGKGKTALLDAIRIGLWPFVICFDLARTGATYPITVDDVFLLKVKEAMARQLPCEIKIEGDYGAGKTSWVSSRERESPGAKTLAGFGIKELKEFASNLQKTVRNLSDKPIDLPLFGYYGTGRLWKEKRKKSEKQKKKTEESTRTFAYCDCLDSASSFKQFEDWFVHSYKKVREEQIKQVGEEKLTTFSKQLEEFTSAMSDADPNLSKQLKKLREAVNEVKLTSAVEDPIKVVQQATNAVLKITHWENLKYSEKSDQSLVMENPEKGILKVDQLSDGIKNCVAMVADIAYRSYLLNSHLGAKAALKTQGIVMIDEVDMHLHPKWQQAIVGSLLEAFPNIQFILTTHSPQVLSTVPYQSIRIIEHSDDPDSGKISSLARRPDSQSRGLPSPDVMAEIQGVDPVPDIEEARWLSEYKALIEQGLHETDSGLQLRKRLEEHFGENHQAINECKRLIRLVELKSKFPPKK